MYFLLPLLLLPPPLPLLLSFPSLLLLLHPSLLLFQAPDIILLNKKIRTVFQFFKISLYITYSQHPRPFSLIELQSVVPFNKNRFITALILSFKEVSESTYSPPQPLLIFTLRCPPEVCGILDLKWKTLPNTKVGVNNISLKDRKWISSAINLVVNSRLNMAYCIFSTRKH